MNKNANNVPLMVENVTEMFLHAATADKCDIILNISDSLNLILQTHKSLIRNFTLHT